MAGGMLLIMVVLLMGTMVNGQQVFLRLGTITITTNNTEILITAIGEDADGGLPSLMCNTDLTTCCRSGDGLAAGDWYHPDWSVVPRPADATLSDPFYRTRNVQVARLNRRASLNPLSPTGSYCCVIPTMNDGEMTFCANLVVCPSLPPLTNGMISYSDPTLGVDSVATHTCDSGYELSGGGSDVRTCGSDGMWSESDLTCEVTTGPPPTTPPPVTCSDLTDPDNGTISYGSGTTDNRPEGTTATYSCVDGFNITGTSTRTCGEDGSWTSTAPICERISCGPPPAVTNGTIMTSTGTTLFEDTATYNCNTGYGLSGSATVTCQANGTWSMEPSCEAICDDLQTPSNGMISYSPNTTPRLEGTVATHSCNTGYELSGGPTRTCTDSGSGGVWSGGEITCTDATIVSPDGTAGDLTGRVLSFTEVGTGVAGNAALQCRTSDTTNVVWQLPDGTTIPSGTAPAATGSQLFQDVNSVRVALRRGPDYFSPDGQYCCVRTTTNERRCVYLTACPTLNTLSQGTVTYNAVDNTATVTCNTGFAPQDMELMCDDGTMMWNEPQPACLRFCEDLPVPANGVINYSPGTTPRLEGNVATHSCNTGYELSGGPTRTCTDSGSGGVWSGEEITCIATCLELTLSNGMISYSSSTTPILEGTVANHSCAPTFVLSGGPTRTCQNDTTWSGEEITCDSEVDCGNPPNITDGERTFTGTTLQQTATYSCNTGYQLSGSATVTCQANGTWTMEPMCNVVDCGSPPNISNGYPGTPTSTTFGENATYTCDPGFTLVGSSTVTCLSTGSWSTPPDCLTLTAMLSLGPSPMAGQSYNITCSLTGADTLTVNRLYQFVQNNPGMENNTGIQTESTLTFAPLMLSHSGQYYCIVTLETSPDPVMVSSANQSLSIQIPTPTVSIDDPGNVFVGQSPQLNCTVMVDVTVVDIPVSASVEWEGPPGIMIDSSTDQLTSGAFTVSTTLNAVTTADSGNYTCTATISSSSSTYALANSSSEGSAVREIIIYPAPSAPNVTVTGQTTSSLTFSWTQSSEDLVTQYSISLTYVGECDDIPSTPQVNLTGAMTEHTFSGLEEFSDYQFNITASNPAGDSEVGSVNATTQAAAPSGSVQNLMASSSTNTSITIQWDREQCMDRNSEIIGYSVTYSPGGTTDTVNGTEFTASGLIPRTDYMFTVAPVSDSGTGPAESMTYQTLSVTDVTLQLDGVFYPDHSLITSTVFSEDTEALHCLTPYESCCRTSETVDGSGAGQWVNSNGVNVPIRGPSPPFNPLYMFCHLSRVSLSRESGFTPAAGIYRCSIPQAEGTDVDIHVGLYPQGAGAPMITGLTLNGAVLSLTCTSTGGPASEVVWTRNGQPLSSDYTLTQTVTSTTEGTYENVLTAQNAADLIGNFSCNVSNVRGTASPQTIEQGVRIDPPDLLTVGQPATFTCEVDVEGMIEWLDSNMNVVMTGTGSSLNYTITVNDSMINSMLYCRAFGMEVSTTLSFIDVPPEILQFNITESASPTAGSGYSLICEVTATVQSSLVNTPTAMWMVNGDDPQVTNGGSTLTFSSLRTSQAGNYTCVGQLTSPALMEPLLVGQNYSVTVNIPAPQVSVSPPGEPLIAGTELNLTCTITTVNMAVDVDVIVDVIWEISTNDNDPNISTSTATGSVAEGFTDTLNIVLSTRYNGATCTALVTAVDSNIGVIDSPEDTDQVTFTVQAPDLPMVTIDVMGDSVAGSRLSLRCTATPPVPLVNPPIVEWVGMSADESTDGPAPSVTLTFDPLRTSDGMVYTCIAEYDIPEADLLMEQATNSTTVNVQIPARQPTLVGSPFDSGFNTGLELNLTCRVELDPSVDSALAVSRTWLKDGTALMMDGSRLTFTEAVRVQDSPKVFETTVLFNLLDDSLDSGNYTCTFNIEAVDSLFITGTTASVSRDIVVEPFPVQRIKVTADQDIPAGQSHTLLCNATRSEDRIMAEATLYLEWFGPDGSPVTEGNGITVSGDSTTMDPSLISTLMFSSVTTSLAGPYTCSVNLTIQGVVTDHNVMDESVVRVILPPPQSVMVNASRTAPLYEGTTGLVISCEALPNNTGVNTTITLNREITGPAVGDNRATFNASGGSLTISPLARNDTGNYTCSSTVSSDSMYILTSTSTTDTYPLNVTALPPPEVTITPATSQAEAGTEDVSFNCSVTVEELLASSPTILWTNSTGHTLMGTATSDLTTILSFDTLRTSDADQYTCTAIINVPGIVIIDGSAMANLSVIIPPPTVTVNTSRPVQHGTNHTLYCQASYSTYVDTAVDMLFTWSGPNGELMDNDNFSISSPSSQNESTLTLTPVDQPSVSSGAYSCSVTVRPQDGGLIIAANNSDTVSLDVEGPPLPVVMTAVPERDVMCGQVNSISCTATVQDNFFTRPELSWLGPDSQTVSNDGLLIISDSTVPGEYTCLACLTVEKVNITDHCDTATVNIVNEEPPSVTSLTCRGVSRTTLEVVWSPPAGQAVLSYRLEVRRYDLSGEAVDLFSVTEDELSSQRVSTLVDELSAGVRYLVTVMAASGSGCGSEQTEECYTQELPPPQVTGVTVDRFSGTAMNVSWDPINIVQALGFINFRISYTVSTGSRSRRQTPSVEAPGNESSVVIDGLNPQTSYAVTVQAGSGGGTTMAASVLAPAPTDPPPVGPNIGVVVGIIIVVVVLIIVVVVAIIIIVFLVRRHRSKGQFKLSTKRNFELTPIDRSTGVEATSAQRRSVVEDPLDSEKAKEALAEVDEVTPQTATSAEVLDRMKPVSLTSFRTHVQNMHDDRAKGFEAEYQSFSLDPLEPHDVAKIPHNRVKNRFANIFPYDESRVLLKEIPGVDGSDYINACWLDGYQREKCYIAAQGPMPNSLEDFWRMIWEYRLANIVMLTKCKEGGRVKCEQYWAEDIGGVFETESKAISVTTISVVPFADFVIRQFTVKNSADPGSEPLKVTQFHFTAWPDHGVPKFATSLISFIRKTQRGHLKDKGVPLLVHCSAGVGRTGTFITLDSMLERIHKETSVNVYAFVKHMRTKRVLMVQTVAQYSFIHDALDELITCGETDIAAGVLRTKVKLHSKIMPGKGVTGFTNQFQLLAGASRAPDPEDLTDANEHYNKDKNRYPDKVPYNMSRARLRPTGEDGSEYINASFVDGYKQRNAYIATQGPLKNTVNDLWRMLWEFKSKTLVMLCNSEEDGAESAAPYWPVKEDETIAYGKINVTLQSKAAYGDFTVRKFTVQEERPAGAKQLEGFTVTQFHHTEWPRDRHPKTGTLIEMLDMITKSQMSTGNRPIAVMCDDGCGRTGTFICIHAQLERLKTEGVVDFFQSIKSARIQRAGLVPDVASYSYCHEALADYIDKFDNYANFKDMI